MTGEEKGAQVQDPSASAGADPGTGGQEALPGADVQQQVSALQQELAGLKAAREQDRRSLQGKIDKDIAREKSQREGERKALQAYVKGHMVQAGASSEELAAFETDYGRFTEGLSDKEKATRFDEMVATQGVEREVREYQDRYIKGIGGTLGIDIPPDHPDLKRDLTSSPEDFEASVGAVAKKLLAEKQKAGDKATLDAAAQAGALGSLGGGPGGVANPLAGITDPEELSKIWVKQGRKIPKASD